MADRRYVCAIDTGGTFTDCVVLDDRGRLTQTKSPSTPTELSRGVFDAMGAAAAALGRDLRDLLAATSHLIVGSTIGTNAVLQQRGARVGMIVTRGHRDVVAIMRGHGRNAGRPVSEALAVHLTGKPDPIVPRSRIIEVDERVDCFGDVVVGLDGDQIGAGVQRLVSDGVDALASASCGRSSTTATSGPPPRSPGRPRPGCSSPPPARWWRAGASTSAGRRR